MADKIEGFLDVGHNEQDEIIVNHPDLKPDENGVGHIVFSTNQARIFARLLIKHADEIERNAWGKAEKSRMKAEKSRMEAAAAIPVDRSARTLTDGSPVTDDHREILPSGQQKGYVVLNAEERRKGFVRPVRRTYKHRSCNSTTSMGIALAETYARDPTFYSGTFCCQCANHFPLDQFVWDGTEEQLGT